MALFGITGDVSIRGNYDGDGVSDHGFWRVSAKPGASTFQVRTSNNNATVWTVPLGQQSDFPVASFCVR